MTILAIESSGKTLSIAIRSGDNSWELNLDKGFSHSENLMTAVASITEISGIHASDLELVSCSAGPGSFTALRIGMSTAKGIARGANCPLKIVPTLTLLAVGRETWPGIVVPVMDARKKRVYTAAFQNGVRLSKDEDIELEVFFDSLPRDEKVLVTGPDARIAENIPGVTIDPLHSSGRGLALAKEALKLFEKEGADPMDSSPLYLRLSEAEEELANRT